MLHLCWLTSYGWAEMVKTESALQSSPQIQGDRQHLLDLLDRQDVIDELEKYGISKVEAVTRINSLTVEEVTKIAGKLDGLPTGGTHISFEEHDSFDGEAVLVILGVLILLLAYLFMWLFPSNKAEVDSPSSDEELASEPVIEEVCDPGMESCL